MHTHTINRTDRKLVDHSVLRLNFSDNTEIIDHLTAINNKQIVNLIIPQIWTSFTKRSLETATKGCLKTATIKNIMLVFVAIQKTTQTKNMC